MLCFPEFLYYFNIYEIIFLKNMNGFCDILGFFNENNLKVQICKLLHLYLVPKFLFT